MPLPRRHHTQCGAVRAVYMRCTCDVHAVCMQSAPARRPLTGRGRGVSGVAAAPQSSIRTPHCRSPPTPTRRRRRRAPPSEPCLRPRPPQPTAAWVGKGRPSARGRCLCCCVRHAPVLAGPCSPVGWRGTAGVWRVAAAMWLANIMVCGGRQRVGRVATLATQTDAARHLAPRSRAARRCAAAAPAVHAWLVRGMGLTWA